LKVDPGRIPALYAQHGSLNAIAKAINEPRKNVQRAYHRAVERGLMPQLDVGPQTHQPLIQRTKSLKPRVERRKAYILTCAQNNTDVHLPTLRSLEALADHYDAQIMCSTFRYARHTKWQQSLDKNPDGEVTGPLWFDPAIAKYISDDRVEIAKGLVWCGELNISPTAERPLSGLEVYTGRASMIVPHTHLQMQSIATVGGSGAKLNYTTGTVTLRNYIQRKEGFKAEFHHCFGGLLVETDDAGHWWVRQLNADSDGTIYDLDRKAQDGNVTQDHRVEAITFGDIHLDNIDEDVKRATWGIGGMVDRLRPRYQFCHDILDFYRRSHHSIADPYKMFVRYWNDKESVEEELENVAEFLEFIKRDDCDTIVVDSNHDRALRRWLASVDGRRDPVNAHIWSLLNATLIQHIQKHGEEPKSLLEMALNTLDVPARFLGPDEGFVILPEHGGGIECGMHFDLGANGSRGSLRQFAKMGRRANGGHSHSCGIDGGAYQAGTKSKLLMGYNHGPSSWSHTDILTYENSKRSLVTFYDGKYHA
jgi:hypothetical protein